MTRKLSVTVINVFLDEPRNEAFAVIWVMSFLIGLRNVDKKRNLDKKIVSFPTNPHRLALHGHAMHCYQTKQVASHLANLDITPTSISPPPPPAPSCSASPLAGLLSRRTSG